MDRRYFLELLTSTGFIAATKDFWNLSDGLYVPDEPEIVSGTELWTNGANGIFEVCAANESAKDIAIIKVIRPDGNILLDLSQGPGGFVRWVSVPSQEIYGPVKFILPSYVKMHVIGTDSDGRIVSAYSSGRVIPLHLYVPEQPQLSKYLDDYLHEIENRARS